MDLSAFVQVGYLGKPHGLKGQLKLVLEHYLKDTEDIALNSLFIGDENKPLPYFITAIEHTSGFNYLVQFESMNDRNAAMALSNKKVFVPDSQFDEYFEEDLSTRSQFEFLIGFSLVDDELGDIGIIEDVMLLNSQDTAQLTYQDVEVLIPLVDDYIVNIDEEEKRILVSLPNGLLEVYTGDL